MTEQDEPKIGRRTAVRALAASALFGPAAFSADAGTPDPRGPPPGYAELPPGPPPVSPPYVFEKARGPHGMCILTPEKVSGPYPLDLHNRADMHRMDIREGKNGIQLDLNLNVVDVHQDCRPVSGARVDIWQCDAEGIYSGVKNLELEWGARHDDTRGATFLRGVQTTDGEGNVRFRTIYPGWYPSRLTHIHFQVFGPHDLMFTSQIAFPQEVTRAVYKSPHYRAHAQNTSVHGFKDDNVFGDGPIKYHMLNIKGDVRSGFTGSLAVGLASRA